MKVCFKPWKIFRSCKPGFFLDLHLEKKLDLNHKPEKNPELKSHSQMEQYFFSYLLTWEVDLIEILEVMAQMCQYVIFLSLKSSKVTSDFILN